MTPDVVTLNNITKTFVLKNSLISKILSGNLHGKTKSTKVIALDDISFSVSKGEIFGIIGRNGSGKTTLMRVISGLYRPDSGSLSVHGKMTPLLHLGLGFQDEFKALDNIITYGMLLGFKKSEIEKKTDEIIEFAELGKFSDMKLKHYSSGMRSRLGFATMIQVQSDILLMDEPLTTGDYLFKQKCLDVMSQFKRSGKTILFTTHSKRMLSKICDRAMLLDQGKAVKIGTPDEVYQMYAKTKKRNKKHSDLDDADDFD